MDKRLKVPRLAAAAAMSVALGALPPVAGAATPIGDHFTIGGFGTLGGVVTNSDEGQYGRDRQTGGADKTPALDVDSNLGVQLDGKATDWLSGTVQVLSAKREDLGFKARIEWAYARVKPLDDLSIRGGRMATPAFLVSDSRNIGYANNWVRPPNEVYALNVFHNFDGGDITYRRAFGAVAVSVTGLAGKTQFRLLGVDATGDDLRGLNLQIDVDWVTLRAGRIKTKVMVPAFNTETDRYSFTGYGFTVDHDDIFVQAERVQRRSSGRGAVVDSNGWYAMGGYRFGPVLPYLIVSRTAPTVAASPFHLTGTQHTTALGFRWDAFKSADLKFQIDRIDTSGTAGASFTTPLVPLPTPGPGPGPRAAVTRIVTAFSLALDFTF